MGTGGGLSGEKAEVGSLAQYQLCWGCVAWFHYYLKRRTRSVLRGHSPSQLRTLKPSLEAVGFLRNTKMMLYRGDGKTIMKASPPALETHQELESLE